MVKDEALQIVKKDNEFFVITYAKREGEIKITNSCGPFTYEEALKFKSLTYYQRRRVRKKLLINNTKNNPCMDCGEIRPLDEMTFDHLKEKNFNIASGSQKTWKQLREEIENCEVVCRSCHNIREFFRGRVRLTSAVDLAELLSRNL